MKAPAEHRIYLAKRDYPLECSEEIFTNEELIFLKRYGFWLEALVNGIILPITDDQKRLMDVHTAQIEPTNPHERTWRKMIERRMWEKDERESPHYKIVDEAEQWFSRSGWKKMRSWRNA